MASEQSRAVFRSFAEARSLLTTFFVRGEKASGTGEYYRLRSSQYEILHWALQYNGSRSNRLSRPANSVVELHMLWRNVSAD